MNISGLMENLSTKKSGPQILQVELCGSVLPAEMPIHPFQQTLLQAQCLLVKVTYSHESSQTDASSKSF